MLDRGRLKGEESVRKLIWAAAAAMGAFASTPASADTICEWIDFSQTIVTAAAPAAGAPRAPPRPPGCDQSLPSSCVRSAPELRLM